MANSALNGCSKRRCHPRPRPPAILYPRSSGCRRVGDRMKEVWTEKYRPRTLDEVVGQEDIVERLKAYVKTGNLPHLLFAGPPGAGKRTCAIALARDLFGDTWKSQFFEMNSSDERGIDVVRNKIKEDARREPPGG